jgi:tetratricopeptide (TPR) repeat protein
MTDSKLSYELNIMENPVLPKDYSQKLNTPDFYRAAKGNGFATKRYQLSPEVKTAFDKAESEFTKNNYEEARKYYNKAYQADSSFFLALTYIGQTYGIEKNWDKAIETYEKCVKLNYIDYMAHWFLADCYVEKGRKEDARREILIAHVLNRNNPRIKDALTDILSSNKYKYDDSWQFTPQYELEKTGENKIKVSVKSMWMGYAFSKALWAYEPGYKEEMGANENNSSFNEDGEKEAMVALLTTVENDKKSKPTDDIKALQKALKNKMIQPFIFYEIFLTERPDLAYQLPEELINNISEYVLKVRCR